VGLTPAERVARESAAQPFDRAAASVNADWGTSYDGKQMQRWAEHYGHEVAACHEAERQGYVAEQQRPAGPQNAPEVLAVGMDGGRVQQRDKNPESQSRWHEDKVLTLSSYRLEAADEPGGDPVPVRIVTSYVATMQGSDRFGELARVEAERRGIREAVEVVVIGDGASWIDTIAGEHFACHERIIDYYHVAERLEACARAVCGGDEAKRERLAERLKGQLYNGQVELVIRWLAHQAEALGPPTAHDPEDHPRRTVDENLNYVRRHQAHMDYPRYRAKGWPIGSGVTESGVKLFNKRVKGTEQFWTETGVEAMLALRGLWLSQDDRWRHYWLSARLLRQAA
jgi:hypothetical protein